MQWSALSMQCKGSMTRHHPGNHWATILKTKAGERSGTNGGNVGLRPRSGVHAVTNWATSGFCDVRAVRRSSRDSGDTLLTRCPSSLGRVPALGAYASLMRSPICADEKSESRTGHVSPPQGRGELGGRNQSGRIGFVPACTGPPFANERMFVKGRHDDARRPQGSRRRCTGTRTSCRRAARERAQKALALGTAVLALTIEDREGLLRALDDARTDASAELRGVLLQEHEWRSQEGLV